jgi:hypothetical protein
MIPLALLGCLVAIGTVVTLADWRKGVFFAIFVCSIQDPIRKVTPDTPALLVLSSLPIWLAMAYRALVVDDGWRHFRRAWPELSSAMRLFVLALPLPVVVVLQYGMDAWRMAVLGLFGYLGPLVGVVVGFTYARQPRDVERVLIFYCIVSTLGMVGGPLEYLDAWASPVIGTEALKARWMRWGIDDPIALVSGFYRSPDIMGWHAAALVTLGATLLVSGRTRSPVLIAALALGAICLLICGRRKMIMMPVVWVTLVATLSIRAGRPGRVMVLSGLGLLTGVAAYYAATELGIVSGYYDYAFSAAGQGQDRFVSSTWDQLWVTLAQSGFFGSGIGVATQGGQHLVGLGALRTWQESGPARVMVELGVPGFLLSLVLAIVVAKACLRRVDLPSSAPNLSMGLIAFAAANGAAFSVSHQVYGDMSIAILTTFLFGASLSAFKPQIIPERATAAPRLLSMAWQPGRQQG